MLKTIQIIALVQGIFLLFLLFQNKNKYKKVTFWLFTFTVISIIFFIIGDDDNNLFHTHADWYLFDTTLFSTFLFLFFKYFKSGVEKFNKKDLLFFIPNIIYVIIELIELNTSENNLAIEIVELLVEFTFLSYLIYMLIDLFKNKSTYWILYVAIPIVLILTLAYTNEILLLINVQPILISNDAYYNSYMLIIIAFLFYFITFYSTTKPDEFLPKKKQKKYKTSNLNHALISDYKIALINAMEKDKLYRNPKLSIHKVSEQLNIPRQYISEVLNLHLNKSFLDFVNEYRINDFIEKVQNDQYAHLTLLGIANEVGFNSKSTFNTTFKKIKGLTPSQFKNSLKKG
ncbi:helix-turn-helix domain-containing protein [Tenacibaculum sp. IB213877]|uniref:helix-turn-helix domain-containing protein n=1 Tax=Tenacibaculum sp. IB213877 TaxID=3097351 RepID=UPI002A5A8665|nr:helix-turn-helix domain-containing protein [Tenacibaculum sp. IB213877]MDY0779362.1 helix-turn-helix domain-containing protein [Tenacibaculum sp. IB213877]